MLAQESQEHSAAQHLCFRTSLIDLLAKILLKGIPPQPSDLQRHLQSQCMQRKSLTARTELSGRPLVSFNQPWIVGGGLSKAFLILARAQKGLEHGSRLLFEDGTPSDSKASEGHMFFTQSPQLPCLVLVEV